MFTRKHLNAKALLAAFFSVGVMSSTLIAPPPLSAATPESTSTMRVAGEDRYATAVALTEAWDDAGGTPTNVVVTSGEDWPDALGAAALASAKSAPVILTRNDALPQSVRDWFLINRSTITNVYVVGGERAVSETVVASLRSVLESTDTVARVAGDTRYSTMEAIVGTTGVLDASDSLLVVSGNSYADALSAAGYAASEGFPIVLTPFDRLGVEAASVVSSWLALNAGAPVAGREVVIVGGPAAVSPQVVTDLLAAGVPFANIRRISGPDRYATSAAFNEYLVEVSGGDFAGERLALVRGDAFADALASAPFLATADVNGNRVHTVLTRPDILSLSAARWINDLSRARAGVPEDRATNQLQELWLIGGTTAIADSVRQDALHEARTMVDIAPTMTCAEGSTSITLTFGKALTTSDATISAASFAVPAGSVTVGGVSFTPPSTTVEVSVSALPAGAEIAFLGTSEAAGRRLLPASCTVTDDVTAPSLTIDAKTGATDFVITSSESLDESSFSAGDITGVSVSAGPTRISGTNSYLVTATSTIAASTVISVPAGAVTDTAGNLNAEVSTSTPTDADTTLPQVLALSVACEAEAQASVVLGAAPNTITLSAVAPYKPGSAGNGYELRLVNQRGALTPTIEYEWTQNRITVTLDRLYHTTKDVAVAFREDGGLPDAWALTSSGTGMFTEADFDTEPNVTSGGTETCLVTATTSEPIVSGAAFSAVSINGVPVALGASTASVQGGTTFNVELSGLSADPTGGIIATVSGMTDLTGNTATMVNYTA